MSSISSLTVTPAGISPSAAASAYLRATTADSDPAAAAQADGTGFGATLERALQGVVDTSHAADTASLKAISGSANISDVVAAVSQAELALQTTVAIRDRVVQAYQDVMRMAI